MDLDFMWKLAGMAPFNLVHCHDLGGKRAGLVVIDEVNGFCTVGAGNLAPKAKDNRIDTMVEETAQLAKGFAVKDLPVLITRCVHEPGVSELPYPPHCERGTGEEDLVPRLQWLNSYSEVAHLEKNCLSGFIAGMRKDGRNLVVDWMNSKKIETLVVTGICTDICVMDFVADMLSARNLIFPDGGKLMPTLKNVVVYVPACATYDLPKETAFAAGLPEFAAHPRELTNYMGLYFMAAHGAILAYSVAF